MEAGKLVSWSLLLEHGFALVLLWTWVGLTGCALLPFLRLGIGVAGAPLLGVIYWTLALYLFPFFGGLDIAAGGVILLAAVAVWQRRHLRWRLHVRGSTLILLLGSLPYVTTLL